MPTSPLNLPSFNPTPKVIGCSGSPRKNGNSDILLEHILTGVQQRNIPAEHYNLTKLNIQGCVGCEACRKTGICTRLTDDMSPLYPRITAAQGLVLVCPSHNYNVTSWMKAFIDRLYCFYRFENDRPRSWSSQLAGQNRKAVIAAVCEQEHVDDMGFTIEAMKKPLEALGYEIMGELPVFGLFDKGKVKHKPQILEEATRLGTTLAESIKQPKTNA